MTQPFEIDDLYRHAKVTALHTVHGGRHAVCSVRTVDRDENTYVSSLWRAPMDGGAPVRLTHGPHFDTSPRLSPDGAWIAFISNRGDGPPQLHVMPAAGGELRQVTSFPGAVVEAQWRPDSNGFVAAVSVSVDPDLRGARGSAPPERADDAPELAWRLPYKADGAGYLLASETHLFDVDAQTGEGRQLTDGPFSVQAFDLHADGRRIAYARTRDGRFAHCTDLWVGELSGTHRRLTTSHAAVMSPAWSPDGAAIAFTGAILEGDSEPRLWRVDVETGRASSLAGDLLDVADPTTVRWSADGRRLVLVRADRGRHHVVAVDAGDETVTLLRGGDRQLGAFAWNGARFMFTVDHPSLASELWCADEAGGPEQPSSHFNPWWGDRTPITAEPRSFEVPDGRGGTETIEGWLLRGAGATQPGPLLNDIHGGPASYALLDFDTNVFWQVLCARGWSVLALNAVGSASFGRDFCSRLSGHWGELDLPQHEAAVRQLERNGVCDGRVVVAGKSYGGYLAGWATGHTDLFKAAVVMAPVGNIETHYGTSDGGYYADPMYVGTAPRFDRQVARRLSPLQFIERSRTPTLFLQGKDDERCPKCQSEELFVSLMRAGDTPAELVLYPGEGHGFLGEGQPRCRADAAQRIIAWLQQHAGAVNRTPAASTTGTA